MDGEERGGCDYFTFCQTFKKEQASLTIFPSLSLLFLCSIPMLKIFCIKNYLSMRKHMENVLDDHILFYCSKLPLEKRAINLDCFFFNKQQFVHQSCVAS